MQRIISLKIWLILVVYGAFLGGGGTAFAAANSIRILWKDPASGAKVLRQWAVPEFKGWIGKKARSVNAQGASWRGATIDQVLQESFQSLSLDQQVRVDLVILRGESGVLAQVPRAFVTKYPLLLAFEKNGKPLGEAGPFATVLGKVKVTEETMPVATYSTPRVSEIWLANSQDFFKSLLLTKRTEPVSLRGEKLYIQTCMACHSSVLRSLKGIEGEIPKETFQPSLSSPMRHGANAPAMPELSERDVRALEAYFRAMQPVDPSKN